MSEPVNVKICKSYPLLDEIKALLRSLESGKHDSGEIITRNKMVNPIHVEFRMFFRKFNLLLHVVETWNLEDLLKEHPNQMQNTETRKVLAWGGGGSKWRRNCSVLPYSLHATMCKTRSIVYILVEALRVWKPALRTDISASIYTGWFTKFYPHLRSAFLGSFEAKKFLWTLVLFSIFKELH
jgi:hypothetical protein